MDRWYEKLIAWLEFSPALDAMYEWSEDESEISEENVWKYVEVRAEKIERIISTLPAKSNRMLLELSDSARDIIEHLKKHKIALGRVYHSPEHALLYSASRESLGKAFDDIIKKYRYLSQVALGIISRRSWRSGNMLPLDRSKWLEK